MSDIPTDACSAISRRLSPDMRLRWLPTIAGKVVVGGEIPFSGFDSRSAAVAAARQRLANNPNVGLGWVRTQFPDLFEPPH